MSERFFNFNKLIWIFLQLQGVCMFSLFHNTDAKPQPLSRFTQKNEAKKIIGILKELQDKESELKKSSDLKGPDSLDYAKYKILSNLLNDINFSINNFNNKLAASDSVDELQNFINLLRELAEHVKEVDQNRECKDTLSQFRNKDRENARTALSFGVWGAIGAAFTFSGLALGASALLVGSGFDCLVDNKTDVYCPLPQTRILLDQLLKVLDLTIKNLILTIKLSQLPNDKVKLSNEDNMICPITRELMDNPYICALDGYSYEKKELEKWLYQHRNSPMTRKPMKLDDKIEDIMIPNRQLKHIIDNYKLCQYVATNKEQTNKILMLAK